MNSTSAQRLCAVLVFAITFATLGLGQTVVKPSWVTHAHDAQHTGVSDIAGQDLNRILWSIPVDLHPTLNGGDLLVHYGSPRVTVSNTVLLPVKNGSAFQVDAVNGKTGKVKWILNTDYTAPAASFTPSFGPILSKNRLIVPAAGGMVLIRNLPDTASGTTTRAAFFGIANFNANPNAYIGNVKINTPIAADNRKHLFRVHRHRIDAGKSAKRNCANIPYRARHLGRSVGRGQRQLDSQSVDELLASSLEGRQDDLCCGE